MRRARTIAFYVVMLSAGLFYSLWGTLMRLLGPRYLPGIAQAWARVSLRALRFFCGITIETENPQYLPTGPAIIAAQHQSALDIFIWLTFVPYPALVFKQELRKIPIFGPLLAPTGMIPVNREGKAIALRKMLEDCRHSLAAGRQVVIFPEGTRTAPGTRAVLQPGIAALAKAASVPIIPVATNSGTHWGPRAFAKSPGQVVVKLFPPLLPGLNRNEVMAQLAADFYDHGVD